MKSLLQRAVAYLNVDSSVVGMFAFIYKASSLSVLRALCQNYNTCNIYNHVF